MGISKSRMGRWGGWPARSAGPLLAPATIARRSDSPPPTTRASNHYGPNGGRPARLRSSTSGQFTVRQPSSRCEPWALWARLCCGRTRVPGRPLPGGGAAHSDRTLHLDPVPGQAARWWPRCPGRSPATWRVVRRLRPAAPCRCRGFRPSEPDRRSDYDAAGCPWRRRPCWVRGHEAGRIAVGHRADLTVFADDPLTTAATDLPDLPVPLTVLDGHPTHRDPSM
nr:amidohydrolase family protein [Streptomyces sp. NBC_01763]